MNFKYPHQNQTDATVQALFKVPTVADPSSENGVTRMRSRELFSGAPVVEIEHNGSVYRLRQTSLGKLILTK
jgi:hemin uptake protein HemP